MHVLKVMKVKSVSAVGVHLVTCLLFSHGSKSYCLTLEKIKTKTKTKIKIKIKIKDPTAELNLASWFCWSSWMLQAKGGWAPLISFPVVLRGWGLTLGYNNHTCPILSLLPQSTVRSTLSTLRIYARPALIIYLILQPFDESHRCTEWKQITQLFFHLLAWHLHTCEVPAGQLNSQFERSQSDEIPFVYYFLYVPCFSGYIGENIAAWNI